MTDRSKQKVRRGKENMFVVHKHIRTGIHYSIGIECEGKIKCWTIPKGPSLDWTEKRLSMRAEDREIESAMFEGVTTLGDNREGTMIVWDRGTYSCDGDVSTAIREGNLLFSLRGEKLTGRWSLKQMPRLRGRDNWILNKIKDSHARPPASIDILVESPRSVISNITIESMDIRALHSPRKSSEPPTLQFSQKSRSD